MARRRSSILDLVEGFDSGYGLGSKVLQDREMAKVMNAKQETDTGYTDQQAADLRAAEASGQYDIAANPDGTYAVTPKAGGTSPLMTPIAYPSGPKILPRKPTSTMGQWRIGSLAAAMYPMP